MGTALIAPLSVVCLLGTLPFAVSSHPYVVSRDGAEVTDQQTGLIWQRCSEGMYWNGATCTGVAGTYTHAAALQCAVNAGPAWRVPNQEELLSIV